MKKKPYNDNLVMASIESLYNQANHITITDQSELKRQSANDLPIIGSLPVTISNETAEQDSNHANDMVLTGLLEAVPTDPVIPPQITKSDTADNEDVDNPFLAIRQAVISAGQMSSAEPEDEHRSAAPSGQTEQTFAGQLAELIDAEIERRLTERLNKDTNPAPAQKPTSKAKQPKAAGKTKKPQKKSATKGKKVKPDNPAPKKTTKARRRPKS